MKVTALRFLVCPNCKCQLDLRPKVEKASEVVEGELICPSCRTEYRIIRGVPRFVPTSAYATSFGYQWNWFRTVQLDSANGTNESERTLEATTGWQEKDYCGSLVLDAGVGAGRFAEIVAKQGGEVVGIDLSTAVDAAYLNIGELERVHLVQADIFAMPFREETFDLAYSVGVLHHTPDTRAAFHSVANMVKKSGGIAVYLYHGYGPYYRFSDIIRRITTKLPLKVVLILTSVAIPLHYVYRVPLLGNILRLLFLISPHRNWRWRWLDTFDWYTPKFQWKLHYPEVFKWFKEVGCQNIEIFNDPIRIRGTKTE